MQATMRLSVWVGFLTALATTSARAQGVSQQPANRPAPPPRAAATAAPAGVDPQMMQLLQSWEGVSRAHETLYAQFTRTDRSPALVEPKVYEGQALLRKPNLACLDFQEVLKDRPKPAFSQRIVCSGTKVFQFLGPTKQVFVYPLAEDERRRAIEEGPLPFLFNMRVEQAVRRYTWRLLEERPAQGDKAATYIIEIIPREAIDLEEFSKALVMLDQKSFLPQALQLFHPNGKDTKTFIFKSVERNGEGNPAGNLANYDGEKMTQKFEGYGYKVIVNPDSATAPRESVTPDPVAARPARPSAPQPAGRR